MSEFLIYASDPLEARAFEDIRAEVAENFDLSAPTDEDVWEGVNHIRELDMEDFWADVRASSRNYTGKWRVDGTLGLWDGPHKVDGEFPSLRRAIEACFNCADEVTVRENGRGRVTINACHHDGTNVFTLYRLKDGRKRNARLRELFGWR